MNRRILFLSFLIISPTLLITSEKEQSLSSKKRMASTSADVLAQGYNELIQQITSLEKHVITLNLDLRKLSARTTILEKNQENTDFEDKLDNLSKISSRGIANLQLTIEEKLHEQSKAIADLSTKISVHQRLVNNEKNTTDIDILTEHQNKISEHNEQISTLRNTSNTAANNIASIFEVIEGLQSDFGRIQTEITTIKIHNQIPDAQQIKEFSDEYKKKITFLEKSLIAATDILDQNINNYQKIESQLQNHINSFHQISSDQKIKINNLERAHDQSITVLHNTIADVQKTLKNLKQSITGQLLPEELATDETSHTLQCFIKQLSDLENKIQSQEEILQLQFESITSPNDISSIEKQLYALAKHHITHMNSIIAICALHCISWTTLEILDTHLPIIITQFKRQNIHRKVIACAAFNTFLNTVFDTTKNGWRVMSIFAGLDLCTNAIHTLWHANKYYKRIAIAYRRASSPTMRSYLSWLTKTVIAHIIA